MRPIRFGTEGWRGIIGGDFTFQNVARVAQAIADLVKARAGRARPTVVVGYDTRFLSDRFAQTISEVFAGNAVKVQLAASPTPTPALCYAIRHSKLAGGVMVTASHNPYRYNGVKWKTQDGMAAPTDITAQIEARIGKAPILRLDLEAALKRKMIVRAPLVTPYQRFLTRSIRLLAIKRKKMRLLIDNLYGVQDGLIPGLIQSRACRVTMIHTERDPRFGGLTPEPIAANLQEMAQAVRSFDIGLALDGDADRVACMRPNGQLLSPGQLFALLVTHLVEVRKLRGVVVKTVSCSNLIDAACERFRLKCEETSVGFKYIAPWMAKKDTLMGGEESGGMAIRSLLPERDGILAGLLILEHLTLTGRTLEETVRWINKSFGAWAYDRRDLPCPYRIAQGIMQRLPVEALDALGRQPIVKRQTIDGVKWTAKDRSWLMLRPSGNEAVLRVYAESPSPAMTTRLLDQGQALAEAAGYRRTA